MTVRADPAPFSGASLAELIGKHPGTVAVFLTEPGCVPCVFMKPALRQLAIELGERLDLMELDIAAARDLQRQYDIGSVPCLLVFQNGGLVLKEVGFHGRQQLRERVYALFGITPATPEDPSFAGQLDAAERAIEASMHAVSQRLAPHVETINAAAERARSRARELQASHQPVDFPQILAEERGPLREMLAEFTRQQDASLADFSKAAQAALDAYARHPKQLPICSEDGSVCAVVTPDD